MRIILFASLLAGLAACGGSPKRNPADTLTMDRVSRDLSCPESQITGEGWGTTGAMHYRGCGRCAGYQPGVATTNVHDCPTADAGNSESTKSSDSTQTQMKTPEGVTP